MGGGDNAGGKPQAQLFIGRPLKSRLDLVKENQSNTRFTGLIIPNLFYASKYV